MNSKILLVFLLLIPFAFGYEIIGNHIIYENDFAKLDVWPHLDLNINDDPIYSQEFKITNKTNQERNLFFAFVFNKPLLSAKAFNLESYINTRPSFGWVSNSFQCGYDFNYSLNVNPDSINSHSLNCFDVNAEGITYYKKDFPFYSGDLPTKTANFYLWGINGIENFEDFEYIDRSSLFNFHFSPSKNKAYYYIETPYTFDALGSNQFKIFYEPDPTDLSRKWDLIAWSGQTWDCILDDSCDAVYLLDPNWLKAEATNRYPINISMGATGSDTNQTFIYQGNITDFDLTVSDDTNRIVVFDQDASVEIDRLIEINRVSGDLNLFVKPLIALAPNIDYNGTDTNGLMAYVVDVNYSDQKENWNNIFWWGSNFEKAAEQGSWVSTGDNDTWSYATTTQFDGSLGLAKKVVFGAGPNSNAKLQDAHFPLSTDYNVMIQFDTNSQIYYVGTTLQTNVLNPSTNIMEYEARISEADFRLHTFVPNVEIDFGSNAPFVWYRNRWNISDKNNTARVLGQNDTTTNLNTTDLGEFLGLRYNATGGNYTLWDNIRIYKILLNQPIITIGPSDSLGPVFSDFNLFWDQDLTQNIDLNIDSDLNIVFDFNVSFGDLNNDSILLYYNLNHLGDDQNCIGAIRNTRVCGWIEEGPSDINWFLLEEEGTTKHFQSSSEDDHAFKHWGYNLDPEVFETKDSTLILNGSTDWILTLLTLAKPIDANSDANIFFNYSFSANYTGTSSRNLTVYDCNSLVVNPDSNENCNSFIISSNKAKDLDNYYSILNVSNDLNQIVGDKNVHLNSDGNHWLYFNCVNCNPVKYWALDIDDSNSNIDRVRNWVSGSGAENLIAVDKTIDAHIHYQDLNVEHTFNWFVQISDNAGTDYNSLIQSEVIEYVNLPPLINKIINPLSNTVYDLNIDVNAAVSDPSNNIIVCDFNLYDSSRVFVKSLGFGIPVIDDLCGVTDFNSLTVADGNYFIQFIVRETATTELYSTDINHGLAFVIDNTIPVLSDALPDGNYSIYDDTPDLNVAFTESNPYYCTARAFIDGVAETDVNVSMTGGRCLYTATALAVGSTIQVMFFMVDLVGNVSNDLNTEIYTILMMPVLPDSRYLSEEDTRVLKTQRYMAQEDIRLKDTKNYVRQEDKRQESDVFNLNVLFKANQNIIILVLGIIFIIGLGWFIWIKK